MRAFVVLAVLGAAFGAPTQNHEEIQTWKNAPVAPVTLFLAPAENERQLRAVGDNHEDHMQRSYYDLPGGPAVASAAAAISAANAAAVSSAAAASAAGPLVGVFPGAKVGGCAIPLLLSCAPSVHSGHLAHTPYASPAYRTEVDHKMRASETQWGRAEAPEMQWAPTELQSMDGHQMQWMENERAMETEVNHPHHHHHHLVALDIHPNNH